MKNSLLKFSSFRPACVILHGYQKDKDVVDDTGHGTIIKEKTSFINNIRRQHYLNDTLNISFERNYIFRP